MAPKALAGISGKLKQWLLIAVGTLCVALGIIGIFLPLMPTTVFFLMAAACYIRSSDKFYNWLITNRVFGKYIRDYREQKILPVKVKVTSITYLWVTILSTVIFFAEAMWLRLLLIGIAIGVTIHILTVRTAAKAAKAELNK